MVATRSIDGHDALTLGAADGLEATFVPGAGMIGCSLRDRDAEVLGQRHGLASYLAEGSTMGIPLLYPWANRLSRDRFALGDREIDLGARVLRLKRDAGGLAMHGLLTAAPRWIVDEHRSTQAGGVIVARFEFGADEALLTAFPFPHRLRYEAELAGRTLEIRLTVEPTGDVPVPLAFGFHPYLSLAGADRGEWTLEAPVATRLVLDPRGLPTGEREPVHLDPGPLGERTFDDAFEAPPEGEPFVLSGAGRRVEIGFDEGYPFVQIYAPADDALIAIEPMAAPTDALVSGDSLRFAAPGETFTARFSVSVSEEG